MKTPLSPSQLLESGQIFAFGGMCHELMEAPTPTTISLSVQQTPTPGQGGAYSLCEVCNLQLTSSAQAQLHYNGRSHLRRVRQLQAGETAQQAAGTQSRCLPRPTGLSSQPAGLTPTPGHSPALSAPSSTAAGSGCGAVGGALPGLIGATGPSVMMKPFLSFPVETTSPVGLFPNFNTMDPVQKAVINHTFGVTMVPKKKQVISCNVCQLRFNSDSQAEAHYRGSRHAKKLKSQENKSKLPITTETNGSGCSPAGPAPLVLAASGSSQHTELLSSDTTSPPLKPFLLSSTSPLCSSSPSSSRAGSEPPPSSPPSALPAPGLSSSSSSSSSSSKASPPPPPPPPPAPVTSSSSPPPPTPPSSQDAPPLSAESEEEKAKKLLYCSLCKVAVNSLSQLEAHNAGSKHKTMLEARSGAGPIKAYPRPGSKLKSSSGSSTVKGSGLQNKTFHCQICDVHVNSEIQLKQHISSRRHKDRVAGKPSKPKYSPYNKQQRGSLTKELVKPSLSPSFLPTPFASPPASLTPSISLPPCSLSSSPLLTPTSSHLTPAISLHPRPPATSTLFTASFLRPAPGPIRTSQGSILFTPY
ncbi:zinc finger protein 385B [Mugil cephalus]|uniref:zinc finger protein 385B n=1 Tax=Mugil cephalus TaxID=48193 RepID=UPI001FB5FAB8|nr:zinc finger protein 385B [Mugil cephalus]